MPQPPLASPVPHQPDRPYEPTTGEWLAAIREDTTRQLEHLAGERERKGSPLTAVIIFLGGAAGAISVCFAAYFIVLHSAEAVAADKVQVVKQQADNTQGELERYKNEADARFKTLERQGDRTEQKVDALLNRFSVPNPAPRPTDGGTP